MAQLLGSLDSSRNLQANYAISFLFHIDLILYACAAHIRRDSFGILYFTSKPGLDRNVETDRMPSRASNVVK